MDVALVVAGDLETTSGGFAYDRLLVDRLRDRGHAVDVISLPRRSYARHLLDNLRPLVDGKPLGRRLSDPDVVVQDGLCHPSLVGVNRRLDAPVVALLHMLRSEAEAAAPGGRSRAIRREVVRRVERRYLLGVDAAVYNSRATRDSVEALVGGDGPDGVVAPPAGDRFESTLDVAGTENLLDVDEQTIRERARESVDGLEVVFLGNVVERKGLDVLVRGLADLDEDVAWRLTVVGDTTVDPGYVRRVQQLVDREVVAGRAGVGDRVNFAGRLPDEAVAATLRDAHVVAMPSRYEPYGIASLEGMCVGCVPVATTNGGPPEFVDDGDSGFLVDPGDVDGVAGALEALADPERLAEMGVAARRAYERQPTWEDSLDRAVDLLEALP